jgi:hypothetical protein
MKSNASVYRTTLSELRKVVKEWSDDGEPDINDVDLESEQTKEEQDEKHRDYEGDSSEEAAARADDIQECTEEFFNGYIEFALWSSSDPNDDSGTSFERLNYDKEDDIAPETLAKMKEDCDNFYSEYHDWWENENDDYKAGGDFWLTREGHGAGFWDGGYKLGKELTDAAHAYGEFTLYLGDDGMIHGG